MSKKQVQDQLLPQQNSLNLLEMLEVPEISQDCKKKEGFILFAPLVEQCVDKVQREKSWWMNHDAQEALDSCGAMSRWAVTVLKFYQMSINVIFPSGFTHTHREDFCCCVMFVWLTSCDIISLLIVFLFYVVEHVILDIPDFCCLHNVSNYTWRKIQLSYEHIGELPVRSGKDTLEFVVACLSVYVHWPVPDLRRESVKPLMSKPDGNERYCGVQYVFLPCVITTGGLSLIVFLFVL